MSEAKWYYKIGQEKFGPVTSRELHALATAGKITKADFVWREGLPKWLPAERVDQLFSATPAAKGPTAPATKGTPSAQVGGMRKPGADKSPTSGARSSNEKPPETKKKSPPAGPPRRTDVKKKADDAVVDDFETVDLFSEFEDDPEWDLDDPNWELDNAPPAPIVYVSGPEDRDSWENEKPKKKKKRRRNRSGDPTGFGKRLLASIIDSVILVMILLPLTCLVSIVVVMITVGPEGMKHGIPDRAALGRNYQLVMNGVVFTVVWMYNAVLNSSSAQATFGKSLLGMRVTDLDGHPIDFWRATARHFAKVFPVVAPLVGGVLFLSSMPRADAQAWAPHVLTVYFVGIGVFVLGHLIQPFTSRRQAFHDMFAGTLVVND